MDNVINHEFLRRLDAASYMKAKGCPLKPSTLAADVTTRRLGIPYHKLGRLVFYKRSDLDAWIESRRVGGRGISS